MLKESHDLDERTTSSFHCNAAAACVQCQFGSERRVFTARLNIFKYRYILSIVRHVWTALAKCSCRGRDQQVTQWDDREDYQP